MASNHQRFLGGSVGSVIVKLLFLSLLVGAFMALLGITPPDLLDRAFAMVRALRDLGFEAFGTIGTWLFYGAVVVIPIWLVLRLLSILR
jgi:hypothetical protein